MVQRGVQLCRALVEPLTVIEDLLTKPMLSIHYSEGMDALRKAAGPFKDLEVFADELALLHRNYLRKARTSRSESSS